MNIEKEFDKLIEKNKSLKSRLYRNNEIYADKYYDKYHLSVINEYKNCRSIFKASMNVGVDYKLVLDWYLRGSLGDFKFRSFFLAINGLNRISDLKDESFEADSENSDSEYIISEYGDGWSYKIFLNGEKIFLISDNLETLKKKVKNKNLPLD